MYWPRKNNIQIRFFSNLEKKFALCVYGEYAKRRKVLKLSIRVSCLIIKHHEKNFRSSHHILDRFDSAKIPSHGTVPLNGFHSMKGGRNFLQTSAPVILRKTYLSTDTWYYFSKIYLSQSIGLPDLAPPPSPLPPPPPPLTDPPRRRLRLRLLLFLSISWFSKPNRTVFAVCFLIG